MPRQPFAQRRAAAPVAVRPVVQDSPRPSLRSRLAFAVAPTILLALGITVVASAQSSSPFASKKKVQAWELPEDETAAPAATPVARRTPVTAQTAGSLQLRSRPLSPETASTPPTRTPVTTPQTPQPAAPAVVASAPTRPVTRAPSVPTPGYRYTPSAAPSATPQPQQSQPLGQWDLSSNAAPNSVPAQRRANPGVGGSYANVPRGSVTSAPSRSVADDTDWTVHQLPPQPFRPGQMTTDPYAGQSQGYEGRSPNPTAYDYGYRRPGETPAPGYEQQAQTGPGSSAPYGAPYGGPASGPNSGPAPKRGFFDRIGMGALSTMIRGAFRGGVAARENDGWEEAFIGDGDIEAEVSTVTQGGLEWGVHGQVRAQYDEGRKGFTRRLPDCPPTLAGCASIQVPGVPVPASVRGHTSQFYTDGPDVAKDAQVALESAHLFLRSAYGDVTVGLDDGAAYLFSLGAPTLLNVGASNSGVDYTGLDAVKTLNDASGFAEKITYTSPRLLGDQVGVGVQLGLSYAPDAKACGVDYCVDLNDVENVVAPDIADILEAGIALDRTFAPGMSVEATATYARGSEKSGLAGLDDLQAFGAGLEFRMNEWTLGGSYLNSNQGLEAGDYKSYDVGLTWKPSALGFTLGYGHAKDDLVSLSSDQFVAGVSYDINERIRVGAGAQYTDRDTLQTVAGTAQTVGEKATALFIEGGITF